MPLANDSTTNSPDIQLMSHIPSINDRAAGELANAPAGNRPKENHRRHHVGRMAQLKESLDKFWKRVLDHEHFSTMHGGFGPFEGWQQLERANVWEAYERIAPFLSGIRAARAFRHPRGVPNDGPIFADSALEALAKFWTPPKRLWGASDVLYSFEYEAVRAAAQDESQRLLYAQPTGLDSDNRSEPSTAPWRPVVKVEYDQNRRLVLSCYSRPKKRLIRTVLEYKLRDVFIVLLSPAYKRLSREWDEFVWGPDLGRVPQGRQAA
jgi:hypothetical protein